MRVLAAVALTCLLVTGCGAGSGQPSRVAQGFADAVAGKDGGTACSLLAPGTRRELEQSAGRPCPSAVLGQGLGPSRGVRRAQRFGDEAQVLLDGDTVFLARFSVGWRVVAAGCTDRGPARPYECSVKGG